jgi:hypothetical protein
MIPSEIIDLGLVIFDHFQDADKKPGVFSLPRTRFFELPPINDITVEDEIFAGILSEKAGNFFRLGTFGAQVNIGDDDGFEVSFQSFFFRKIKAT